MHIDEVHQTLKRSFATTIKTAQIGIDYYKQRIRELEGVIASANQASKDEVTPVAFTTGASTLPEMQSVIEAVEREITNGVPTSPTQTLNAMRRAAKEGTT